MLRWAWAQWKSIKPEGSSLSGGNALSKTCLKRPLKKEIKIGFQYQLSLNECQTYCRMLQREHSAILSTFIKLPFVIKIFVLSIFEWPLKAGLTELKTNYPLLTAGSTD